MKKTALILFSIACLTMGGCVEPSSSLAMSYAIDVAMDLSFSMEKYEVESGEYVAVRADISCEDDNVSKKIHFSLAENDGIASLVGQATDTDGTIYVSGKKRGTVKLTAICAANPNITASVDIEVVDRIPSLKNVWNNVNEIMNYTLLTTRTAKSDNTVSEKYIRTLVTDDAIIGERYYQDDNDFGHYTGPFLMDEENNYVNGYAIDKNGYAFLLKADNHGNFLQGSEIIDTEHGLLKRENYRGFKDKSIDINDVGLYYGLQAINPSWLPNAKAKGTNNTYVIIGDNENIYGAYVKYLLWGLMDPIGRNEYRNHHQDCDDVVELSSLVDLSIKAISSSQVKMTLSYLDGVVIDGEKENYTYTTTIEDINTTTLPQTEKIKRFTNNYAAPRPALPSDLALFSEEIGKHNYVISYKLFWPDPQNQAKEYSSVVNVYYTEKYIFLHYPDEFISLYTSTTGKSMEVSGYGYMRKSDGIHGFEYRPETSQVIKVYEEPYEGTINVPVWECVFEEIPDYFEESEMDDNDTLYALSLDAYELNEENKNYHYSSSYNVFTAFCDWFFEKHLDGETIQPEEYLTCLRINTKMENETMKLDSVDFFVAFSTYANGWSVLSTPTLSKFGKATENVAHQTIMAKIGL